MACTIACVITWTRCGPTRSFRATCKSKNNDQDARVSSLMRASCSVEKMRCGERKGGAYAERVFLLVAGVAAARDVGVCAVYGGALFCCESSAGLAGLRLSGDGLAHDFGSVHEPRAGGLW